MVTNERLLEVLHYVEEREKQGYGVIAIDLARALQIDTQTARTRLKELEETGMLEHIANRGRNVFRFKGHTVKDFSGTPMERASKYGDHEDPWKLTKEGLAQFIEHVKPGDPVEYLLRIEMHGARKVGYVQKTTVKKVWPYCVQLNNGHSCTYIEMWWWVKRGQVVGVTDTESFIRREA